jgi:glycine/D-amino acid oxidase-like deaminating enzyme
VRAKIVINAAGAWAGEIGNLAGAMDVGLQPMKRTVCLIEQPTEPSADSWPMLFDVEARFAVLPLYGSPDFDDHLWDSENAVFWGYRDRRHGARGLIGRRRYRQCERNKNGCKLRKCCKSGRKQAKDITAHASPPQKKKPMNCRGPTLRRYG